jgi:hypothetical protein
MISTMFFVFVLGVILGYIIGVMLK